jgi:hypothetical protein
MIAGYREICLGEEGIEYIKTCLSGGKTLANLLLQAVDSAAGKIITFLPSDISEETANQFTSGGKLKEDLTPKKEMIKSDESKLTIVRTANTDFWLRSNIHLFLTSKDRPLCIFEDDLAKPTDPWLSSEKMQIFTLDDEVYHFLLSVDAEDEKIDQAIGKASSYLFVGVMTSVPHETAFPRRRQVITLEDLRTFSERTEKIVVGAYDGEGYLIWSKD